MLPQAVSEQYLAQQRLTVSTLGLVRREWAQMGGDLDASWAKVGPRITMLTASAQLGAARNGAAYVPATLSELGDAADMKAAVNVRAFAGVASDGRPLESLLYGAVVKARTTTADSLPERLKVGGDWLDMAVHAQVADAGRGAASVAITATPHAGYVRMVNPPCCARCAVLSGKTFLFNQGFQRHPRCDCLHAPISLAGDVSRFTDMLEQPSLDQIKGLSKADRRALADGADFNRLVNVQARSSGMRPKMARTRGSRLMPDDIYRLAKDRDDAMRLLQRNGYLTESPRVMAASAPRAVTPILTRESARTALEQTVKGKVHGLPDDFVPERVQQVADTLADLKSRYGVEVHDFGFGGVSSQGSIRAAGDADFAGNMRVGFKSVSPNWRDWERLARNDAQLSSTFSGGSNTTGLQDLILHEYGHVIDFALQRDFGVKMSTTRIAKKLAKEQGVANVDYDLWLRKQMSLYGRSNREETIAEAFLDVEARGEDATDLSKRIHAELVQALRKAQGN